MQKNIEQVIAQHGIAPEPVFQPERAVQNRIILLGGAQIEPDSPDTMERLQFRRGDMTVVVPQESALEGRPISYQRCQDKRTEGHNAESGPAHFIHAGGGRLP